MFEILSVSRVISVIEKKKFFSKARFIEPASFLSDTEDHY